MELITDQDIHLSNMRRISKRVKRFLGLDAINNYYSSAKNYRGVEFTSSILKSLNISYSISGADIDNIPATGAAIVISNHPSGLLDGVMLLDAIARRRSDVKSMSNFLLTRVEPMREFFLAVNPFEYGGVQNISGIRQAMDHLAGGGLLIIFPAGEVSTYRGGVSVKDKDWSSSVLKFIRGASVPIIPVYIDAQNSLLFHLAGLIHPLLRTARLPIEFKNKQNHTFDIRIGSAIAVKKLAELNGVDVFGRYLRASVDFLRWSLHSAVASTTNTTSSFSSSSSSSAAAAAAADHLAAKICDPVDVESLLGEIKACGAPIYSSGEFGVYLFKGLHCPSLMREVGRLREITFREVGEGTQLEIDVDVYDGYYSQLIVWDSLMCKVVGGYRLGFGNEIMARYGVDGFYTSTLFRFSGDFVSLLGSTIELGRSFIIRDYQKHPVILLMLWRGILSILLQNRDCGYLFGPVSISGNYRDVSKSIIIDYIQRFRFNDHLAACVEARGGVSAISRVDTRSLSGVDSLDLIDRLVRDIERGNGVPVLLKRYLQINGRVLAFNVDPLFKNSLDAFILVSLQDVPESMVELIGRDLCISDIKARFGRL